MKIKPVALALTCAIALRVCTLPLFAEAEGLDRSEHEIKAAFLLNFARFTEWPAEAFSDPEAPLVLGLIGNDALSRPAIEAIAGKTVNGRRLQIRQIGGPNAIDGCHMLFIGGPERKSVAEILTGVQGKRVLTVADIDSKLTVPGMIRFYVEDDRVRFEVNLPQVERAGLKLSAKLLRAARVVRESPTVVHGGKASSSLIEEPALNPGLSGDQRPARKGS